MKAYLSILSARFRTLIQYRAAAFAGFITQLFWGFIKLMILLAFYESTSTKQPISFTELLSYVWLGQAFLGLLPWNVDKDVQEAIRTGSIAYELLRPLGLYRHWFVRSLAWRTATASMRSVPLLLVAGLLIPLIGIGELALPPPPGLANLLAFFLSMGTAILLSSALTTLFNITLLWTVSGTGAAVFFPSLTIVFSGLIIPLPLLPEWAQSIVNILPFRGLADVPFRFYSGNIDPSAVFGETLFPLAWLVALILLGIVLIHRGMHRVTIQGG